MIPSKSQNPQDDLEKSSLAAASRSLPQQYGAIEPKASKELDLAASASEFSVAPEQLLRILLQVYVLFFAVYIGVDIAYLASVDARFPPGINNRYPSEAERKESVSYLRERTTCSIAAQCMVFCIVMLFAFFGVFTRVDAWLQGIADYVVRKSDAASEKSFYGLLCRCIAFIGRCGHCCCTPMRWCMAAIGRCCCSCSWCTPIGTWFENHSWRRLIVGSTYLVIFAMIFFLVQAPFMYWHVSIDLHYGFANKLAVSLAGVRQMLLMKFIGLPLSVLPAKFVFLFVLQFRFGWLLMWVSMVVMLVLVQFNMKSFAPMVMQGGPTFPTQEFGVGRGFPLVDIWHHGGPMTSLNRIYLQNPQSPTVQLYTNDKSSGQLVLNVDDAAKSWVIAGREQNNLNVTKVYAKAPLAIPNGTAHKMLQILDKQTWFLGNQSARVGVRSGKMLRDKLFTLAKERNLIIEQIYMIDGSHKDSRANAFVAGINGSIIGLYDTLFLGGHEQDTEDEQDASPVMKMVRGDVAIQSFAEMLQDVDVSSEDRLDFHISSPTEAMTDDEIVGILAHELAHPALHHLEQGMVIQAITSFVTFGALGWAAHSPLLAASFSLAAPAAHVGACVYDHLLGPPLEKAIKLFTDWHTRYNEYQADAYVAKMSNKYGSALQTALAKMTVNSNEDPDEPFWYEALHLDHPTMTHRWLSIDKAKQDAQSKRRDP